MSVKLLLLTLLLSADVMAGGALVHVPADAATIQLGIDAVDPGGTVIVAPGVYNELIDLGGKALTLRCADPGDPAVVAATIISGAGLDGPVVLCDSGEGPDTAIHGLTIQDGNGQMSPFSDPRGGGMRCIDSSPTVAACVFRDNQVGPYNGWAQGGGLYVEGGHPLVVACRFIDNGALATSGPQDPPAGTGGGMAVFEGSADVIGCLFVGNRAGGGSFDGGGGLYVRLARAGVEVINCTFVENELDSFFASGGGILGGAEVTNSILWGNDGDQLANIPGPVAVVTWSDVEGGFAGVGNIDADPLFNARLVQGPGSPVIDAADNGALPGFLVDDLAGEPRRHDDPFTADTGSGAAPLVDMGTFEFQGSSICGTTKAAWGSYGQGKPGTNGIPVLSTVQLPIPGQVADLTITNGLPNSNPATQPLVVISGPSPGSIPFDGGALLVVPATFLFLAVGLDGAGSATLSGMVPADTSLCGSRAFFQVWIVNDPGAAGFYQTSQTNGVWWLIGGG